MRLAVVRRNVAFLAASMISIALMGSSALSQTLKEKVAAEGKLTIGVYNAWPDGFVKEGEIAGTQPEILREVAKSLGVKTIDFQVMDFGALIPSLMARRIDVIAGGMYVTPNRCKQVAFSNPVGGPRGNAILVKAGNPLNIHSYQDMAENSKIRVGNLRGAASLEYMAAAGVPKERIQLFQDHPTGLAALLAGRVDMLINASGAIVGSLKDPNVKGLERAEPFKEVVNGKEMIHYSSFAFRPEDKEFRDLIDQGLAQKNREGFVAKTIMSYGFPERDATPTDVTAKELCGSDYR